MNLVLESPPTKVIWNLNNTTNSLQKGNPVFYQTESYKATKPTVVQCVSCGHLITENQSLDHEIQ